VVQSKPSVQELPVSGVKTQPRVSEPGPGAQASSVQLSLSLQFALTGADRQVPTALQVSAVQSKPSVQVFRVSGVKTHPRVSEPGPGAQASSVQLSLSLHLVSTGADWQVPVALQVSVVQSKPSVQELPVSGVKTQPRVSEPGPGAQASSVQL